MKPLNVIFTYNRPYLLDNCVRSFQEFGPGGDLLLFDDCSDMPEMTEGLNNFKKSGLRIQHSEKRVDKRLGGLYSNMEQSVTYAKEKGYDYIFFIQDDQQFMWKDDQFWETVEEFFNSKKNAFLFRPQFEKMLFSHDKANRFKAQLSPNCWLNLKTSFTAIGVLSIKKLIDSNWEFKPSEGENNEYAKSLGFKLYVSATPVLAFVPEPETWHNREHKGKHVKPRRKYFLKPLSEENITKLKKNGHHNIAFMEDYCIPWGWKALSPYNHSSGNMQKYYKKLWRWIKKNRFTRWPRFLGVE